MQQQLQQRLSELQEEFSNGQQMLNELEIRQSQLRESMLRISGAIQVLEEVLAEESQPGPTAEIKIRSVEQTTKQAI